MKIIKKTSDFLDFLNILRLRGVAADGNVERDVRNILDNIEENGDMAVLKYTRKFDDKKAEKLTVAPAEIRKIAEKADPEIVKALESAARRIRKFHEMQAELLIRLRF
jgi:histidinol dehydrogenase